jgi:hypothetical protein
MARHHKEMLYAPITLLEPGVMHFEDLVFRGYFPGVL